MNLNEMAKEICEREDGKKEITIAQVKEVLGIVCDLAVECPENLIAILKAGTRRK